MSKELQVTNTALLPVAQRAAIALGLTDEKKAELKALAARTTTITVITNADGYKQVHAGRMALKNERIELQKMGKEARQDATNYSKAVIAQENSGIEIIEPEEKRLQSLQDDYDEREERAKQAKIEAEQKRVQDIQDRITELRAVVDVCTRYNCTSDEIAEHLGDIERIPVDDTFQEFRQQAEDAKAGTLIKLRDALAAAKAREEEKRKADEAQAELAKLRAEAAAREAKDKAEREARELAERLAKEAAEKAQRDKLAAEQAERARLQKIEQDRIDAENKKLADARAAFEREQAEVKRKAEETERARLAAEAAEARRKEEVERLAKKAKFPGERAIVDALMERFGVTEAVVNNWLSQMKQVAA